MPAARERQNIARNPQEVHTRATARQEGQRCVAARAAQNSGSNRLAATAAHGGASNGEGWPRLTMVDARTGLQGGADVSGVVQQVCQGHEPSCRSIATYRKTEQQRSDRHRRRGQADGSDYPKRTAAGRVGPGAEGRRGGSPATRTARRQTVANMPTPSMPSVKGGEFSSPITLGSERESNGHEHLGAPSSPSRGAPGTAATAVSNGVWPLVHDSTDVRLRTWPHGRVGL